MNPTVTADPPALARPDLSHSLMERSPMPMAELTGARHVLRYVNPAFCHLVGKSREALLGTPFADTVQVGDSCLALVECVYRTGEAETHTEAAHPESPPAYWSYTLWPVLDAEHHPVGVMVQVIETTEFHQQTVAMNEALVRSSVRQHELTEAAEQLNAQLLAEIAKRKQTEARLTREIQARRAVEEQYRLVAAATRDAVYQVDPDGRIAFASPALTHVTGYTMDEILGRPSVELYIPEATSLFLERRRRALTGEPVEPYLETELLRKDGTRIPVEMAATNFLKHGQIAGRVAVVRDITARKAAEAEREHLLTELQRINAEFQQFAYIVSHDLSEPLRMVTNFMSMLAKRYHGTLDADADEYIGFAMDGARRMQQMLTDLLAYTRAGQTPEFQAVDCETVLERVLDALQLQIAECGATITHDSLPTVPGDATRLGQVFQNLLSNALKFRSATPSRIHVSAHYENQHWQFAVRDNGIGIDPAHTGRLFQVFQRLHTRSEYAGTGIGLAICKRIIEQHGGRIWVESQPREGSIFYFTVSDSDKGGGEPRSHSEPDA